MVLGNRAVAENYTETNRVKHGIRNRAIAIRKHVDGIERI